ncbi:hypothetical protein DTO96_102142 [Ephemeroptericola cinctiostellae]|uniref:Tail fiber assembly protein n=1 Tax=Ephemeroptericola cinctiostellae TaxID=2268024 RepID=A0A345DDF0_9BURK|nr:hypothetical protein [Ephemeroptericola cinctiostellae]AXF86388.1 hypothetical protein DTO96_102142 [Ephemeroptericola cinctiostellae]
MYPNHPQFKLAYEFDAEYRYLNVTLAHISPAESAGETAVYLLDEHCTFDPVPYLAPEGKDWFRSGGQQGQWLLVGAVDGAVYYDTATGQQVAAPAFGQPVPNNLTTLAPEPAQGQTVDAWDEHKQAWTYRADLAGVVAYSTKDASTTTLTSTDRSVPDGYTTKIPNSAADEWNGTDWIVSAKKQAAINEAARKAAIPQVVTMRQAKLALLQAGYLDNVDAAISADGTPRTLKIEWEYASEVQRVWVEGSGLAEMLKLTDGQLDDLFILAASL